ncbi:Uncharacterised protein [Burkholderia pseudomallei]|nr:Uncharacterised protein [Burkholderia pseudomallei]
MPDRRHTDLLGRDPQMGDRAARVIAEQTFDRLDAAELVVRQADREHRRGEARKAFDEIAPRVGRLADRRTHVSVLEARPAAAPRQRDAARRVLHPAEPLGRNVAEHAREHRHRDMPFGQHPQPMRARVIAPVRILRADRERAPHDRIRRREPEHHAADAVRDDVHRLARARARRVLQHRIAIETAPVEPGRMKTGERRGPRFADAAIVVDEHVAALAEQIGGEAEVIAAAHGRRAIDDRHRPARGGRAMPPREAAHGKAVGGRRDERLGRKGVGLRVLHIVSSHGYVEMARRAIAQCVRAIPFSCRSAANRRARGADSQPQWPVAVAAATAAAAARKRGARACARCAAVRAGDGSIRSRASPRGHRAASPTESNDAAGRRCDRMTPRRSNDTLLDLRQAGSEPRHAPKRPRTVSGMRATHDATRAAPRFPCAPRATTPLHGRRNARRAGMRRQSRAARGLVSRCGDAALRPSLSPSIDDGRVPIMR